MWLATIVQTMGEKDIVSITLTIEAIAIAKPDETFKALMDMIQTQEEDWSFIKTFANTAVIYGSLLKKQRNKIKDLLIAIRQKTDSDFDVKCIDESLKKLEQKFPAYYGKILESMSLF